MKEIAHPGTISGTLKREVEINRKTKLITVDVEDNMKLKAVREMLRFGTSSSVS